MISSDTAMILAAERVQMDCVLAGTVIEVFAFGMFLATVGFWFFFKDHVRFIREQLPRQCTDIFLVMDESPLAGRAAVIASVTWYFIEFVVRFWGALYGSGYIDIWTPTGRSLALRIYQNYVNPIAIWQSVLLLASVLIMDGLLIFRVSKVWACKKKLAILPGLVVIGLAGCAIRAIYLFACPRIFSEVTALDQAKPWIVTAGGFSIFINMYCTILLRWGRFGGIHHDPRFDKPSSNEVSENVAKVFAQTASATYFWYTFLFSFWLAGVEMRFMVDMTPVVLGIFHMFGYLLIEVKRTEACHAWIKAQDIWTGEDDYKDVKSTFFADITAAV